MEQVKQLGCQQRSGPAREAPTQMSTASIVPGHCNSTNQHLIAHSQSTPRSEYVLGKPRTDDGAFNNINDGCDDTHVTALDRGLQRDRHLPDGAPAQRVPLPLRGEQPQLLLLVLPQVVAVPEKQIGEDLAAAKLLIGPSVALHFLLLHFKSPCAEKTRNIVFQTQSP